jgi:hypothetical protein
LLDGSCLTKLIAVVTVSADFLHPLTQEVGMKFRTRLSLDWLELRDVPDGTLTAPPTMGPPPPSSDPGTYTFTPGGDTGVGGGVSPAPIGGGGTYMAPPPPTGP